MDDPQLQRANAMSEDLSIFIGFHSPAAEAYEICKYSIEKYASAGVHVFPLVQDQLRAEGLYTRPLDTKASNEFSMTRWLAPHLSKTRYAIFMDSDMLLTGDIKQLIDQLDKGKAAYVVKHDYTPRSSTKMSENGEVKQQYVYPRKNWSSFVIYDCEHPAITQLTPELINSCEPSYVHRFSFLRDDEIGDIGNWVRSDEADDVHVPLVNFLVGEYPKPANHEPLVLHYTLAIPGYHDDCSRCDYYRDWIDMRDEMRLRDRVLALESAVQGQVLPTSSAKAA